MLSSTQFTRKTFKSFFSVFFLLEFIITIFVLILVCLILFCSSHKRPQKKNFLFENIGPQQTVNRILLVVLHNKHTAEQNESKRNAQRWANKTFFSMTAAQKPHTRFPIGNRRLTHESFSSKAFHARFAFHSLTAQLHRHATALTHTHTQTMADTEQQSTWYVHMPMQSLFVLVRAFVLVLRHSLWPDRYICTSRHRHWAAYTMYGSLHLAHLNVCYCVHPYQWCTATHTHTTPILFHIACGRVFAHIQLVLRRSLLSCAWYWMAGWAGCLNCNRIRMCLLIV